MQKSSSFQHLNLQTNILPPEQHIISPIEYPNQSSPPKSESGVIKMSSPLDQSPNLEKPGYHQIHESPTYSEGDVFPPHLETSNKKKLVISGFSGIKSDLHNSYDTPIFRNDGKEYMHSAFTYNNLPNASLKHSEQLYNEVFQRMFYQHQYRERPLRQIKVYHYSSYYVFLNIYITGGRTE